jgi:hypothetical protein
LVGFEIRAAHAALLVVLRRAFSVAAAEAFKHLSRRRLVANCTTTDLSD